MHRDQQLYRAAAAPAMQRQHIQLLRHVYQPTRAYLLGVMHSMAVEGVPGGHA